MSINEPILTFFPGFKWRPFLKAQRVASIDDPLILEAGGMLREVTVVYETYGKLAENKDNVILITHALTGDSHPSAHDSHDEKGWWDALIGPGRPLDTERFFIICSNVLGGCQGTTGPASLNPATDSPYGMSFPTITIGDMVRTQKRLLDALQIDHLLLVLGGSIGGMQAMQWAVTYPDMMDGVINVAAPGYSSAQAIAYSQIARQAIRLDPDWQDGNYYGTPGPTKGLSLARSLGMVTYRSELSMQGKFGRRMRGGQFEIENYLDYQGDKLVRRFDANSYLYLLKALDLFDLGAGYSSYTDALARIKARVLTVGVSSDALYPSYQQRELAEAMKTAGVRSEYVQIDSGHGHDGFLIDFHLLRPILLKFIHKLTLAKAA